MRTASAGRAGVRVDVGDDLAGGGLQARVAGARQAAVLGADQAEAVLAGDLVGRVGRAVVDDDHLVVRVLEVAQAVEAAAQRLLAVVRADDHRDPRPVRVRGERHLRERLADRGQRLLRGAVAVDQAEGPVVDLEPAAVPLVRPGEHEHAGAAGGEGGPDLPVERRACASSRVAQRVEAGLGDDERPVAGDVLEPSEVGRELRARLEEHVEAHEVDERQREVLGARIVHVGDQRARVLCSWPRRRAASGSARSGRWPCQRTIEAGISLPIA